MPPKLDLGGSGFSVLLTSAFNPSDHEIDEDDAQRLEIGLPDRAVKTEIEAYVRLRMTIYDKNNWNSSTLTEYFREDFSNATEDVFRCMNGDLRRKFRDYLRDHGVFIPKKKNMHVFIALASAVEEELDWPNLEPDLVNHVRSEGNAAPFPIEEFVRSKFQNDPAPRRFSRYSNTPHLFKAYSDNDDKYSSDPNDDFDQKYSLFLDRCNQADIDSEEDRRKAFSIVLTGDARKFHFQNPKEKSLDLSSLVAETRGRFQTEERSRALLRDWDDITLANVRRAQPNKKRSECLNYLTSRLSDIQCCLPQQYRNDVIMRERLLNAVRDTPACGLAYKKPAPTVRGVVADLQASVATGVVVDQTNAPMASYVDRRRHDQCRGTNINRGNKFGGGYRDDKKCIVCGRPSCWSTNHPFRERMNALKNNKHIKAFVAQFIDDTHDDPDNEGQDAIDDLVAHVLAIFDGPDVAILEAGGSGDEDQDNLQIFFHNLSDVAVLHTFTHQTPLASRKSCKDVEDFRGILIDTGAARGNTSSMKQYLAYCNHVGCVRVLTEARPPPVTLETVPKDLKELPRSLSHWVPSPSRFTHTFSATQ